MMLFLHSVSLKYERLKVHILSSNLLLAHFDSRIIDNTLSNSLAAKRISQVSFFLSFVCFPLKLVLKGKEEFQKIHLFFFPSDLSLNNRISEKT